MNNLRQYINLLRKERQIVEINAPVSSDQERKLRFTDASLPQADPPCSSTTSKAPIFPARQTCSERPNALKWPSAYDPSAL